MPVRQYLFSQERLKVSRSVSLWCPKNQASNGLKIYGKNLKHPGYFQLAYIFFNLECHWLLCHKKGKV